MLGKKSRVEFLRQNLALTPTVHAGLKLDAERYILGIVQ